MPGSQRRPILSSVGTGEGSGRREIGLRLWGQVGVALCPVQISGLSSLANGVSRPKAVPATGDWFKPAGADFRGAFGRLSLMNDAPIWRP